MPHEITEQCLPCGACLPECPFDAILPGDEQYRIQEDRCEDCGVCTEICPLDAIHPKEDGPSE